MLINSMEMLLYQQTILLVYNISSLHMASLKILKRISLNIVIKILHGYANPLIAQYPSTILSSMIVLNI